MRLRRRDIEDRQTVARISRRALWNTSNGTQKIPFDTVEFDPGGNLSVPNQRYVCPTDGFYQVHIQIGLPASGPQAEPMIYKSNVYYSGGPVSQVGGVGGAGAAFSDIIPCKAGDYLEMYCWLGAATQVVANGGDRLTMAVARVF